MLTLGKVARACMQSQLQRHVWAGVADVEGEGFILGSVQSTPPKSGVSSVVLLETPTLSRFRRCRTPPPAPSPSAVAPLLQFFPPGRAPLRRC